MKKNKEHNGELYNILLLCMAVLGVLAVLWTFTGTWPWREHAYYSYMLQARSWLEGRLDLGRDYEHLELAIFNGKYYVSFPPFPSYVMLPFAALHLYTADGLIGVLSALGAAVYAYRIMRHFGTEQVLAAFFALFATIGSNFLFIAHASWVWFIAQNLAFSLSLAALYYALMGRLGLSLALWACAVGCRPLDIVFLPVLLYAFYGAYHTAYPNASFSEMINKNIIKLIPMAVIAISYMLLNYARFGNPIEFGHNYLPEFTRSAHGQFSAAYLRDNLASLVRLPKISFREAWEYQKFDGTNMFIISPIFISYIAYSVCGVIKKRIKPAYAALIFAAIAAELVLTACHKTMGGAQFGNRYTVDVLPLALLGIAAVSPQDGKAARSGIILFLMGLAVNCIGTVLFFV